MAYFDGIKVGDTVWVTHLGKCEVSAIDSTADAFIVTSHSQDRSNNWVDFKGRWKTGGPQSVFWQEPTIIDKGRPNNMSEYRPAVGEECLISGPNCDAEENYVFSAFTILWSNDTSVLYGKSGCLPNLNKWKHIKVKPIPQPKRMVTKTASCNVQWVRNRRNGNIFPVGERHLANDDANYDRLGPAVFVEHTWEEEEE